MNEPKLYGPCEAWRDDCRRGRVVAVPDVFGKLEPVLNERGEPVTIEHEELAGRTQQEAQSLYDRVVRSCTFPIGKPHVVRAFKRLWGDER